MNGLNVHLRVLQTEKDFSSKLFFGIGEGQAFEQLDRAHNRTPVSLENPFAATTIPNRRATQAVESLDHQFERMKPTAPEFEFKFRIQPQCVEDTIYLA